MNELTPHDGKHTQALKSKGRVLVIEDDKVFAPQFVAALEKQGYAVERCVTHVEAASVMAKAHARGRKPDVILNDHHTMMGLNGETFLLEGHHRGVPIIGCAGGIRENKRQAEAAPNDFLGSIRKGYVTMLLKSIETGIPIGEPHEQAKKVLTPKQIKKQKSQQAKAEKDAKAEWQTLLTLIDEGVDKSRTAGIGGLRA